MAIEEAEDIFGATALLQLVALGVLAYFAYKIYSAFKQTNCGPNGDQRCCRTSDVNTAACVDASGNPCGWGSFLTFKCYSPTGTQQAVDTARQDSTVMGGFGAIFQPDLSMATTQSGTPSAPLPGLPVGYDPTTGTISSGSSGGVPTWGITPGTSTTGTIPIVNPDNAPPTCFDSITGNTYPC